MSAAPANRSKRFLAATATALALHVAFLAAVGLETPRAPLLPTGPDTPVVQIELPPRLTLGGGAPLTFGIRPVPGVEAIPSPLAGLATPQARVQLRPARVPEAPVADFPGFFSGGLPGCGREDVILLTTEEKVSCSVRLAIGSARARRGDADAPAIDPLAALPETSRSALDAAVAQRGARPTTPVTACKGVRSNLGAGCLPGED